MRLKPKTNAVAAEPPTEPLRTTTTLPLVAQTAPAAPLCDSAPAEPAPPVLVRAPDASSHAAAPCATTSDATEPCEASANPRHSHLPPAREKPGGGTEHRADEPAEGGPKSPAQLTPDDPEHAGPQSAPTAQGDGPPAFSAAQPDASAGLARTGILVQPLLDQSRLLLAESHLLLSGSHLVQPLLDQSHLAAAPTTAARNPRPVPVSTLST